MAYNNAQVETEKLRTAERRVRTVIDFLRYYGVRLERDGEFVRVICLTPPPWMRHWLERHSAELIEILPPPCRPEITTLTHNHVNGSES